MAFDQGIWLLWSRRYPSWKGRTHTAQLMSQGLKLPCKILVAKDANQDVFLGTDFQKNYLITMNFADCSYSFLGRRFPLYAADGQVKACKVVVEKNQTVAPWSEMMITGKWKRWCCEGEEGLFEPKTTKELGFLVRTAISRSDRGEILVHVTKTLTEPQVTHQGAVIWHLSPGVAFLQEDPGSQRLVAVRVVS